MPRFSIVVVLLLCCVLAGCSGASSSSSVSASGSDASPGAAAGPAQLQALQISPSSASLVAGTTRQLEATALFTDGTRQDVTPQATWQTASSAVRISNTLGTIGLAQGLAANDGATVTAAFSGLTATAQLQIVAPTLVALDITPAAPVLAAHTTQRLTASAVFDNDTSRDVTSSVTWTSSAPAVAQVAPDGTLTAVGPGQATITAASDSVSREALVTVTGATLQAIQVTTDLPSLAVSATQNARATGLFSDNTTQDLTAMVQWTTSDPAVKVTAGVVSSTAPAASVVLTATLGAVSGSATIDVTSATLVSIDVTPDGVTLNLGGRQAYQATGRYSDGTRQDLTRSVTWRSTNFGVAIVDAVGLATTVGPGETTISATLGDVVGSEILYVAPARLQSIEIAPRQASVAANSYFACSATGTWSDGTTRDVTNDVSWLPLPADTVIRVSNAIGTKGLVYAVRPGTGGLSARLGGVTGVARFDVSQATLDSLTVTPAGRQLPAGLSLQFTVMGSFSDGHQQDFTRTASWSSSNPAVAAIVTGGLATGRTAGPVTITAAVAGLTGSAPLTVTPAFLQSLTVTPAGQTIARGQSLQFKATGAFSDNVARDVTSEVTWTSSTPDVTVSNARGSEGLAFGVRPTQSAAITATSGALSASATMAVRGNPHVYVANRDSANISGFSIDPQGALIEIPGSPFASAAGPEALTSSASFLYAGSPSLSARSLSAYAIDPNNGELLPVQQAPFTTPFPRTVTVLPSNAALFATDDRKDTVSTFLADPLTGALQLVTTQARTGRGAAAAAVSPDGRFLYTANAISDDVSAYTASVRGVGSLGTVAASSRPQGIAVDPKGRYVYVADNFANNLHGYGFRADGSLRPLPGSPYSAFGGPVGIAVDPSGQYVYVTHVDRSRLSAWKIEPDGSLDVITLTTATGNGPYSVAVDRSGSFVYVGNADDNTMSAYAIDRATGDVTPRTTVRVGTRPSAVVVLP